MRDDRRDLTKHRPDPGAPTVRIDLEGITIYTPYNCPTTIDLCRDTSEHWMAPPCDPDPNGAPEDRKRRCSLSFEELVPESWKGKRGRLRIRMDFDPEP